MSKPTILVVDDEMDNLDAIERIFRKRYHLLRASSGAEALTILEKIPEVAVLITDQRMPAMTGVELLEKTLTTHAKTVRILLTGYTDVDSIISAVNQGHIFRYLTKPWDSADLTNSVEQAVEHYTRGQQIEIKNRELEAALSELKTLDQAKNKFMVLINHELKTPLTVIISFLELISETSLTDDQKSYLDRIKTSALRLQKIIDDTLILVQHQTGLLKPKLQNVSFQGILQTVLGELSNDFSKKNLHVAFSPNDLNQIGNIFLDTTLMKLALHHLIQNAVRFSPEGSEIKILLEGEHKSLTFTVENAGPPIPENVLQKLNTPFNLQSEIMNHSKGLGLGLSVATAIVQRHGGHLHIENIFVDEGKTHIRASFSLQQ